MKGDTFSPHELVQHFGNGWVWFHGDLSILQLKTKQSNQKILKLLNNFMGANSVTGTGPGSAEDPYRGLGISFLPKILNSDKLLVFDKSELDRIITFIGGGGGAVTINNAAGPAFTFDAGAGITITTNIGTNTVTITNTGGGTVLYSNANPTPVTIGGIPAGSTFLNQTMQQMWDALLYPYQYPAFTAFAITGVATQQEVGVTLPAVAYTFTWATTNGSNVSPNTIAIYNQTGSQTIASGEANDGIQVANFPTPVQRVTVGSNVWRIDGTNTQAGVFSRTFTVNWLFRIFYGTSLNTSLTESQIEGLANNPLSSTFVGSWAVVAGGYKYFCYPDFFGSISSIKDETTGFNVAMATSADDPFYNNTANGLSYGLVSVTNAFSVTTDYRVYRTRNILGGSITLVIT